MKLKSVRSRQNRHSADADMQMTIHLIEAYFQRARGEVPGGTIDFYFSSTNTEGVKRPQQCQRSGQLRVIGKLFAL